MNTESGSPAVGLILAAGSSRRMGGFDKVFADLLGKPVIAHSLITFSKIPEITGTLVVTSKGSINRVKEICNEFGIDGVIDVIAGGTERNDSARLGLEHLHQQGFGDKIVLIHDAARPLVTPETITAVIEAANRADGAIPVVHLNDTVKRLDNENVIRETIPREPLRLVQTPQGFKLGYILDLHRKAVENDASVTDDAMLAEVAGGKILGIPGSHTNLKITRPEDLEIARVLLNK